MGQGISTLRAALRVHILLPFLALILVNAPAFAWDVLAVRDKAGNLAFCRAETKDNDTPLSLAIALSPLEEVNIGIKVPDAGFNKGEAYDVKVAVDTAWTKKVKAETVLEDLLIVRLGKAPDFLAAFEKGKSFTMAGDEDHTEFPLTGSKDVLAQLRKCIGMAGAEAVDDLAPDVLPPGVAALLQAAEIDAQPVPLPKTPGRMVDYAWVAMMDGQKIDGGFIERKVDAKATFNGLVDKQVALYEKQCQGKPKTQRAKAEKLKGIDIQKANIACGDETGAFVFYKTDTNIFATIIHRAPAAGAKAATHAQGNVADVVRRLAAE